MSTEGWEELDEDEDVASLIRPALRRKFDNTPKSDVDLDLELLDLKLLRLAIHYMTITSLHSATSI